MIAIGVDVSTKRLAFAGIREDGSLALHALELDHTRRGARRLTEARSVAYAVLCGYAVDCCTVMVEEPARGDINRIAVVVSEAAQAAIPRAVVWTVRPQTWKFAAVGHGGAPKQDCLAYAQIRGYVGADQDLADALCMAAAAWKRWDTAIKEAA